LRSSADHAGDRGGTKRRYTVAEAAGVLGLSAEAVRSRLARGTLTSTKQNGTVYVVLDADQAHDQASPNGDRAYAQTPDQTALVDALRDQVADLRRRLDSSEEANRENRRIIAGLVQRVPELEAPRNGNVTPADDAEGVETRPATEGAQEGAERRSWWRRWFGG
jgi:hypothetical protein